MTDISKTVVVLGATGQQGGSVAAALRADGWAVRAVVRDPSGPRARSLSAAGVETVRGDLADPESLRAAFSDAYGVFGVQPNSGQAGAEVTKEDEVRFGTAVADIAERCGVAHLVHSSAITAGSTTGVDHLGTKSRTPPDNVPLTLRWSLTENMLNTDPPDHTRLRRLVNKAFTPRTVVRMRAPSSRSPVGRPTPWGTPARWI
jgi:nucleoside-diphosphate-sugar epimerase